MHGTRTRNGNGNGMAHHFELKWEKCTLLKLNILIKAKFYLFFRFCVRINWKRKMYFNIFCSFFLLLNRFCHTVILLSGSFRFSKLFVPNSYFHFAFVYHSLRFAIPLFLQQLNKIFGRRLHKFSRFELKYFI